MVQIDTIAEAALAQDGLQTRCLVQEFLRANPHLATIPQPHVQNQSVLAAAAALLELLAARTNQNAPEWTATIGPASEPVFLLKAAGTMKRLRALCLAESPEPLRKRGFYAPPDYLDFA